MSTKPVFITHTGCFLPNLPVDNEQMESLLGQVADRPSRSRRLVLRSNQIKTRYYAIDPSTGQSNYTNAELCAEAIKNALGNEVPLAAVSSLAAATSIADQLMPGHGVMVHGLLGSPPCEVASLGGICVSGMSAFKYAWLNVAAGLHETAVAAASEAASYSMRAANFSAEISTRVAALEAQPELAFEKDFLRWMLSDGAGACVLQSRQPQALALRVEWLELLSYAGQMPTCMYAGARKEQEGSLTGWQAVSSDTAQAESFMSVKQDVKLLNENIVRYTVEEALASVVCKHDLKAEDIDYFLPHYSSDFFRQRLDAGMKKVGFVVDQERWFTNLASKGNTGSASIFIMLDELFRSGRLRKGEKILCYVPESGRFSVAYMLLQVV
ncbi:beta-ketoacyl-ACP synthase III [Gilvimarinus chinensis]|uniref:beta-ketoacyl-ACP synthase III n=1 Tax=Gilvimarinus chinensis TaxID=396005 RepID=UPI000372ABF9|nr:beta-ketoacyl-ACP synthase III [Gilvimarinus chinensis]